MKDYILEMHYSRLGGILICMTAFLIGFIAPSPWVIIGFPISLFLAYAIDLLVNKFSSKK